MKCVSLTTTSNREHFIADFCNLPVVVRSPEHKCGVVAGDLARRFIEVDVPIPTEYFVLYSADRAVGRVMANLSSNNPSQGFIGLFEMDLQYRQQAGLLLQAAVDFLMENGARQIVGPVAFHTWFPYRFKTSSNDWNRQYLWEPHNPPEYPEIFKEFGMDEFQRYYTAATSDLQNLLSKLKTGYQKSQDLGFTIRKFKTGDALAEEIPLIHKISMEGFRSNFLFHPIGLKEFSAIYVPLVHKADISLSRVIISPDGQEVGFFMVMVQGKTLVLKSATVLDKFRGLGLSNAMLYPIIEEAIALGCDEYISALMISGAQSSSYSKHGCLKWEHYYSLFSKDINS